MTGLELLFAFACRCIGLPTGCCHARRLPLIFLMLVSKTLEASKFVIGQKSMDCECSRCRKSHATHLSGLVGHSAFCIRRCCLRLSAPLHSLLLGLATPTRQCPQQILDTGCAALAIRRQAQHPNARPRFPSLEQSQSVAACPAVWCAPPSQPILAPPAVAAHLNHARTTPNRNPRSRLRLSPSPLLPSIPPIYPPIA